ncbi:MAG TPA: methyltransferase domain-containing protein [Thermohalobaculum sp.]|nr:methyltransferase domain-containing protein [Thermohalobaculum sp.]
MTDTIVPPPSEFVQFWNEILVPKFVKYKHVLVGGLGKHSAAIFPKLEVNVGEKVMDAGAGFGDTAIMLAKRVGPKGHVTAIDCCDAFLDYGRKDAAAAGVINVGFVEADIQFTPFAPEYDLVFSRFGTMFFENPVAAMRNMRKALRPGGRFTMIVWRDVTDNPWLGAAKKVALKHLPQPGADARTCGPGPFSMADQELVTAQMKAAGFADITFERVDAPVRMGDSIEDAIGFQLALGPAGEVYREAGDKAAVKHDALVADLTRLLEPHASDDGVFMASSSWVVSARNPSQISE